MNVTERDAALDAKFAAWEISSTPITPGGNGAGTWESPAVLQHYVRAIEQVGTDRYKQVVLTALNIGSDWFLSDEPDDVETGRQALLTWLRDPSRDWETVVSWEYHPEFRSASLTAIHTSGQAFLMKHHIAFPSGATFAFVETTARVRLT